MATVIGEQGSRSLGMHLDVFLAKQDQVHEVHRLWQAVSHALGELLIPRLDVEIDSTRTARARSENDKRRAFDKLIGEARDKFIEAMQNPTVILATTGTTSSGKSTLVNFLCGSEIMPVAVGEKSAGIVTIHHSEHRKLSIQDTPGATWPRGDWPKAGQHELTDEAIREVLDRVMSDYNKLRDQPGEPACPIIDLWYPTRLGRDSRLLDLPKACTFRILDLPGLKYVGDEGNSKVIRQNCREALCLVLYDSAEVDPQKKRNLLEQVADQVKELGGSPARMLFVLNRIDAFGQNIGGHEEEEEFVRETERAIREILDKKLPEHRDYIRRLKPVKLSAKPGLLALIAQSHIGNEQLQALQGIDDSFRRLIPTAVRDELLGNVRKWKPVQIQAVTEGVMRTSHSLAFEERLRSHVRERLPELIIPQAVDRFRGHAEFDAVSWADVISQAELNSSTERYQRECERIAQARSDLSKLRQESSHLLRSPFERLSKTPDMKEWKEIVGDMERSKQYSPSLIDKLPALYIWRDEPAEVVDQALGCIQDAITDGRALLQPNRITVIDQLSKSPRQKLANACDALRKAGYEGTVAIAGNRRTAADATEREELQRIHRALKELGKCLESALAELVHHSRQNELERVYEALHLLFDRHRDYVERSARDLMRELGLKLAPDMPLGALKRVQSELMETDYTLEAGLDIRHHTRQVQTGTRREEVGRRNETWQEAVRSETSSGFFGWLKGKVMGTVRWVSRSRSVPIFDDKPVYEFREYDETTLPAIASLLQMWKEQTSSNDGVLLADFSAWFLQQAEAVDSAIEAFQTSLLVNYQTELDAVHAEAKETTEKEHKAWSEVQNRLQMFRDGVARLASLPTHE